MTTIPSQAQSAHCRDLKKDENISIPRNLNRWHANNDYRNIGWPRLYSIHLKQNKRAVSDDRQRFA
jgi:hypothetical protein